MASLHELNRLGQSVWLDFIDRNLLSKGGLAKLVDSGVTGVTTNPSIFHKAITGSADYDDSIRALIARDPSLPAEQVTEALMVADVQAAADVLHPVYQRTAGADGYVSLEVPPDLAFDAARTVRMAHQLWQAVDRPNVMIKVPGTREGVEAFEALTADGINVNVTLLFAVARYEEVVRAWARGLARAARPQSLASVASFFVSRVDGKVDAQLDALGTPQAQALRGRIAVANAKLAYERFQSLRRDPAIASLLERGARPQRPLWASTSTKNPAYRDVLYVETLIGADTVNTMPPDTLDAFVDHGEARATIAQDMVRAHGELAALNPLGIDLDAITARLEAEGVAAFADSWQKLLEGVRAKCTQVASAPAR